MSRRARPAEPAVDPIERFRARLADRQQGAATLFAAIGDGAPSADALHVGHQNLRRLRLDGALWAGVVPRGFSADQPALDTELKRVARAVGQVRDVDVALELIAGLGPAPRPQIPTGASRVLVRAVQQRALVGRRELRAAFPPDSAAALLERIARPTRASLPRARAERLREEIDEATAVALARLERTLGRVYRRPTVRRLHRLRVALRSVRYLDLTRQEIAGARPLAAVDPLRSFQEELGVLNDWVVVRRLGQRVEPRDAADDLRDRCRDEIRVVRRRLTRSLERRPVRRAFARLVAASPV